MVSRAARDRNMTDHKYHYLDMNAIRFPLSIMNIMKVTWGNSVNGVTP